MPLFFTCKQVSHHLSKEDYAKLSPIAKFTLKFHVLICPVCGAYNRQVMKFQDLMRSFRKRKEQELERPEGPELDKDSKDRIKEALKTARKSA